MAEARKTVTVVFTDVTGSTSLGERLDPEALRRVMERYFGATRSVLERHGGMVEKFIGDAVMAVFGIPTTHEDDALRAVKAAAEMRERLAVLNTEIERERGVRLTVRTGINTGEAVVGDPESRHFYATGDAVNVAARLEQAAAPGEILLGPLTQQLVRDAVRLQPLAPLSLKGRAEAVEAWRLLEVLDDAPAFMRRLDTPFVGRQRELGLITQAFERAASGRVELVTVVGAAGIGKSRLTRELLGSVGEGARVLVGRCLPYGEGITYWPLAEIVKQVGGADARAGLAKLLVGDEHGDLIATRVAEAAGLAEGEARTEEIFWAVRRLLEELARERPLVVVFDDLQWAEPTFLDLIEYVASFARAPLLVLCVARPELLESRPSWSPPKLGGTTIVLEPFSEEEAETLIQRLLRDSTVSKEVLDRIVESAEGNPLFVEQMLALAREHGAHGTEAVVPPTIQALLAARIDRLPVAERAVLERASIEGRLFHTSAVSELLPTVGRNDVPGNLLTLVRKEFIRPATSLFPGDDGFRFGHILIRDAAYSAIPKELRAELHERLANWLEARSGEHDEIVGYHLEQALRYQAELGPVDEGSHELAARAGRKLAAGGQRAVHRSDMAAAASLLTRAAALLPAADPQRLEVLLLLGAAFSAIGKTVSAETAFREVVDLAEAAGDRAREWRARLDLSLLRAQFYPGPTSAEDLLREAREAISAFEELGDEQGLAAAWRSQGQALYWLGELGAAATAAEQAISLAKQIGDRHELNEGLRLLVSSLDEGPMPASEAIQRCEEILARAGDDRSLAAAIQRKLARLYQMQGKLGEARRLAENAVEIYEDLGLPVPLAAALGFERAGVSWAAGDLEVAERDLRRAVDLLTAIDEKGRLSTIAINLAALLCEEGKEEEAEHFLQVSEESAAGDDWVSQTGIKSVRASLLARRGEFEAAITLAREALADAEGRDNQFWQGQRRVGLAEVLDRAGEVDEAAHLLGEAISLFETKGNLLFAERARRALARVEGGEPPPSRPARGWLRGDARMVGVDGAPIDLAGEKGLRDEPS
jgi:class 3 adenylate cyclase/tetratricopeptide (TPR) repeat protein